MEEECSEEIIPADRTMEEANSILKQENETLRHTNTAMKSFIETMMNPEPDHLVKLLDIDVEIEAMVSIYQLHQVQGRAEKLTADLLLENAKIAEDKYNREWSKDILSEALELIQRPLKEWKRKTKKLFDDPKYSEFVAIGAISYEDEDKQVFTAVIGTRHSGLNSFVLNIPGCGIDKEYWVEIAVKILEWIQGGKSGVVIFADGHFAFLRGIFRHIDSILVRVPTLDISRQVNAVFNMPEITSNVERLMRSTKVLEEKDKYAKAFIDEHKDDVIMSWKERSNDDCLPINANTEDKIRDLMPLLYGGICDGQCGRAIRLMFTNDGEGLFLHDLEQEMVVSMYEKETADVVEVVEEIVTKSNLLDEFEVVEELDDENSMQDNGQQQKEITGNNHQCPDCGKPMKSKAALTRHLRYRCHNLEAVACPNCDKRCKPTNGPTVVAGIGH